MTQRFNANQMQLLSDQYGNTAMCNTGSCFIVEQYFR